MNVELSEKRENKEVKLGSLSIGNCFYFGYTTLQAAIEDGAIYMVVSKLPGAREDSVSSVSVDGTVLSVRDKDHTVVRVTAKVSVTL